MRRHTILEALCASKGEYISGEHLSQTLGITRSAVWKGVDALRREGYEIESRTRLGYRLLSMPDTLEPEALAARLNTAVVGRRILFFDTLDSTNTYAKQAALTGGENGLVILAGQQTGGRGRSGRSFQSPPSKGLYLTALLRPTAAPAAVLPVTALAAVAACRAIERICGLRPGIKWTNDLVLDTRKLVGILTEMGVEGETGVLQYMAVGIGINLNQTQADFSGAVADMATSLRMVLGRTVSRAELAVALMEELDRLYAALLTQDYAPWLAEYRRSCVTLGHPVRILGSGPERVAYAEEIDDAFGLVVRYDDGRRETIRSGEVSVRGLYGYV